MLEAAVIIDTSGKPLHWHLPAGRTSVHLPDSRSLWGVLWENRARLSGLAHTHPGTGRPVPSFEDLTTFAACEAGLGLRLSWWIATMDQIRLFRWSGPDPYDYRGQLLSESPQWLNQLRIHSRPTAPEKGDHHAP